MILGYVKHVSLNNRVNKDARKLAPITRVCRSLLMDFWVVLGVVGSVASLTELLLPIQSKNQRIMHVAYGLAIAVIASVAVWYWQANQRIHKVEVAATRILGSDYTNEGFIQAALAFLEKNRDLYPDSYARAQELCKLNSCLGPQHGAQGTSSLDHALNQNNVAFTLKGLIRGISKLETGA